MQAQEARPPYVRFDYRAEEDREASIREGQYTAKNVAYALITPQGSKDQFEYRAEDWFANLRQQVVENRFPEEWLERFTRNFAAWKNNEEIPLEGTSVKNWPIASPAQVEMMVKLGLRTVEDMASANEESLQRLGMGGRTLKQQAINWLATAQDTGKVSAELSRLQAENEDLRVRNSAMEDNMKTLFQEFEALRLQVASNQSPAQKL
jgi:hypothetical protein